MSGEAGGQIHLNPMELLKRVPKKSILKSEEVQHLRISVPGQDQPRRHSMATTHFDEANLIATFNPAAKESGPGSNCDIDELSEGSSDNIHLAVDRRTQGMRRVSLGGVMREAGIFPEDLAQRFAASSSSSPVLQEPITADVDEETPEQREHRIEFDKMRKHHYKEGLNLKEAKKFLEQESEDDDDTSRPPPPDDNTVHMV